MADWRKIISELEEYKANSGISPIVTLWGGEPLVSPYFDDLARELHLKGFRTEIISNGVLINEHSEIIKNCIDRVYISLDGPKPVHDAIRGEGVFDTVKNNLKALAHENVTIMSVITPELVKVLPHFLEELKSFGIRELYLQDMIGLSAAEIAEYKLWMKSAFGINAVDIDSWENNSLVRYGDEIDSCISENYGYRIEHKKHICDDAVHCKSAFCHMHIAWNGNVLYCTDFYDFSAGNVKNSKLIDIFNNELSEKYREEITAGNCSTCRHCSWRTKNEY